MDERCFGVVELRGVVSVCVVGDLCVAIRQLLQSATMWGGLTMVFPNGYPREHLVAFEEAVDRSYT